MADLEALSIRNCAPEGVRGIHKAALFDLLSADLEPCVAAPVPCGGMHRAELTINGF
jgi:hypothetical protein